MSPPASPVTSCDPISLPPLHIPVDVVSFLRDHKYIAVFCILNRDSLCLLQAAHVVDYSNHVEIKQSIHFISCCGFVCPICRLIQDTEVIILLKVIASEESLSHVAHTTSKFGLSDWISDVLQCVNTCT